MKNIQKLFAISFLMLSSSVGAWCTTDGEKDSPAFECSTVNHFGFNISAIAFCTDWSCTTPFNAFTGSQLIAINDSGTVDGADKIAVNLPTSGTYGYIRLQIDNDFKLNGYGKQATNSWCATGSSSTYATEALAKAVATKVSYMFQLDKYFRAGNGVDAAGYGEIEYGYGTGQNNIPDYSTENAVSPVNEFTTIYRRDDGNDDLFMTTVLQGDYDFGSGKIPSTITFGITVTKYSSFDQDLADEGMVNSGKATVADGSCITYPTGFLWDFVIS